MNNEEKPEAPNVGLHPDVGRVTLTGHELKAALELIAPDGDADQLDGELVIEWWDATVGRNDEAGYYAWYAEYPEEGCILLTPNAQVKGAAEPSPLQATVGRSPETMMGYIRHNAIVVTSWNDEAIKSAAEHARSLGLVVLVQDKAGVNGYRSMLVCPDGSKEGWDDSNEGDKRRADFRAWLDAHLYEDGSSCFEWFEAAYGVDDRKVEVEAHAWMTPNAQDNGRRRRPVDPVVGRQRTEVEQ